MGKFAHFQRGFQRGRIMPSQSSSTTSLILLIIPLVVQHLIAITDAANSVKQILSFGGNGMIGSEVLTRLIKEEGTDYNITLVSRGSWHFDNGVRVMPYVNAVVCDRNRDAPCAGLEDCDINTIHYLSLIHI